jgi:hypothetical protein
MAQVVNYLTSNLKALSSNTWTAKNQTENPDNPQWFIY